MTPGELIQRVRVAFWSFDCDPGIASPDKHAGLLPLGCDGSVTATPKDRDGLDVPPSIHGSAIEWELRRGDEVIKVLEPVPVDPFTEVLEYVKPEPRAACKFVDPEHPEQLIDLLQNEAKVL